MATQKQINTIISEISSAEEPGSVTNVMVGTVLDHLNTGAVNRVSDIADLTEKVDAAQGTADAAKNAAGSASTQAANAQTQANKAYNEAIAAHEAAVAAFPIARGVALENNVNTLTDNLDTLAGRHNALADTVAAFPKFLPIDGQLTKEYIDQDGREPESGVWLVPSPDEGCWYFQSYGDTDWYGHAEEEYNSDLQYIPGLMYIYKNQIATIENDTIKVMGSELVKAIQDADEAKVPGLYVLRNGEPLLVAREANKNARTWTYTQLMLSGGGIVTRTATIPIPLASGAVPSEIEWEDWQSLQGGGAIKVVNKAFIEEMEDSGVIEEGVFYVENNATLYFFTYSVAPCETKISNAGVSYRTYKNGAWTNWVNKAEKLAEAAKGAIYTEDDIDTITDPQVYTLNDGSALVVTSTFNRGTAPMKSQFHITSADIQVRATPQGGTPDWTAWQSIASVKSAQTTADDALAAANTAKSTASSASYMASDASKIARTALDGVGFLYRDLGTESLCMATLNYFLERGIPNSYAIEGIVICHGEKRLVVNTLFTPSEIAEPFLYGGVSSATGSNIMAPWEAINDWDGLSHTLTVFKDTANRGKFAAIIKAYTYLKSETLKQYRWWLPSLAELFFIYANIEKINFALSILGKAPLTGECWSSTEVNSTLACSVNLDTGNFKFAPKTESLGIIGVTHFMDDDMYQTFCSYYNSL